MSEILPIIWAPGLDQTYAHAERYAPAYAPQPEPGSYDRLFQVFTDADFEPHFVQLDWKEDDPYNWAEAMLHAAGVAVKDRQDKRVILGGFSLGALAAILAAERQQKTSREIQLAGLVLASVSPYFGAHLVAKTLSNPESGTKDFSATFKANLAKLRLPELNCPIQIYVGQREIPPVREMFAEACNQWPQAVRAEPDCYHDVLDEAYIAAIWQHIGALHTADV
jgi:dienelactone hydrolase